MAGRAEGDQVLQPVRQHVKVVGAGDVAKGAEGRDVMDLVLAVLALRRAAVAAAATVASAGRVALRGPTGAIVISNRIHHPLCGSVCALILHGGIACLC